jgi:hypothetical protein
MVVSRAKAKGRGSVRCLLRATGLERGRASVVIAVSEAESVSVSMSARGAVIEPRTGRPEVMRQLVDVEGLVGVKQPVDEKQLADVDDAMNTALVHALDHLFAIEFANNTTIVTHPATVLALHPVVPDELNHPHTIASPDQMAKPQHLQNLIPGKD